MNYLDFEEPIQTLREQLEQAKEIQDKNDLDMTTTVEELEVKIQEVTKELYSKLTPWQRVQVSRHPDRCMCARTTRYARRVSKHHIIIRSYSRLKSSSTHC